MDNTSEFSQALNRTYRNRLNASVKSVTLYRLKTLDDISLSTLNVSGVKGGITVPSDIDDPDLSNAYIQSLVNSGKTPAEILTIMKQVEEPKTAAIAESTTTGVISTEQQLAETAAAAEAAAAEESRAGREALSGTANALRWQKSIEDQYPTIIRDYQRALKDKYIKKISEAFRSIQDTAPQVSFSSTNNAAPSSAPGTSNALTVVDLLSWDITQYCQIKEISGDLEFNNQATVDISLTKYREVKGQNAKMPMLPKENDVLEIVLLIPNSKGIAEEKTFFSGMVTGISFGKEYGQLTNISLVAYGISKMLVINKMVTDRAIISQFEEGALAEIGLTVWSNYFANQTVDTIFHFLMTNEMAMRLSAGTFSEGSGLTEFSRLSLERNDAIALQARIAAQVDSLTSQMESSGSTTETFFNTATGEVESRSVGGPNDVMKANHEAKGDLGGGYSRSDTAYNQGMKDANFVEAVPAVTPETDETVRQILGNYTTLDVNRPNQLKLAQYLLFQSKVDGRVKGIDDKLALLREEKPDSGDGPYKFEMQFDPKAFTDPLLFQFLYIPLITMFAVRAYKHGNEAVARFSGVKAAAFDFMLRESFQLFFSQLQNPAGLMDEMRKVAKFQIYENEKNQIVAELPRYNEFVADSGESINDFIITNPIGRTEIIKQDMNLVTRYDVKQFWGLVGAQDNTLMSRQYTDISVLSKYGMRADAPKQNPNAASPVTAQLFAALEVTANNANTRTISLNHAADRQFKLGRLYFIAANDLEREMGTTNGMNRTDGYVGYLTSFRVATDYGGMFSYQLSFNYVRKAKLIAPQASNSKVDMVANFKVLPDLGSLIAELERARREGRAKENNSNPNVPPVVNPADVVRNTSNELVYLAKNALWPKPPDNVQPPRLYNAADIIEVSKVYSSGLMAPLSSKQKLIDPEPIQASKTTYKTLNGDLVRSVPIMMKGDVGPGDGNITQGMAQALNILDLRMRGLGAYLLNNMKERNNGFSEDSFGTGPWKSVFIPSYDVNPWFFWMSLTTEDERLNPLLPTWSDTLSPRIDLLLPRTTSFKKIGGVTRFRWGHKEQGNPVRIKFIGNPVMTKDFLQHFTILFIDDSEWKDNDPSFFSIALAFYKSLANKGGTAIPSETVEIHGDGGAGGPAQSYVGTHNLFTAQNILDGKSYMSAAIDDLPTDADNKTRLKAELDFACNSLSTNFGGGTRKVFLPILIQGDISDRVAVGNAFTGQPLTLMDTGNITSVYFTGNLPVSDPKKLGENEHAEGNALDASLVPFYAKTGLYLSGLNSANHPMAEGVNHPLGPTETQTGPVVFYDPSANYRSGAYKVEGTFIPVESSYVVNINGVSNKGKNLNMLSIPLSVYYEPGSESAIRTIFERTLSGKILPDYFNIQKLVDALGPEDRVWYHIRKATGTIRDSQEATPPNTAFNTKTGGQFQYGGTTSFKEVSF